MRSHARQRTVCGTRRKCRVFVLLHLHVTALKTPLRIQLNGVLDTCVVSRLLEMGHSPYYPISTIHLQQQAVDHIPSLLTGKRQQEETSSFTPSYESPLGLAKILLACLLRWMGSIRVQAFGTRTRVVVCFGPYSPLPRSISVALAISNTSMPAFARQAHIYTFPTCPQLIPSNIRISRGLGTVISNVPRFFTH